MTGTPSLAELLDHDPVLLAAAYSPVNRMIDHLGANMPRAVAFDPNARSYEAFSFGERGTGLLDPLEATSLDVALAEVTAREHLDRGDRLGVRELGDGIDLLHIYAVRRTDIVTEWRTAYDNPAGSTPLVYKRRLEHICTVDLRVIRGEHIELIGNPSLDEMRRQRHVEREAQRPGGSAAMNALEQAGPIAARGNEESKRD